MVELEHRVLSRYLREKIIDPVEAVKRYMPRRGVIAFGGMAGTAIPKEIPRALSKYIGESGEEFRVSIVLGGSTTSEFDDNISRVSIAFRTPTGGSSKLMRNMINKGYVRAYDTWLYKHIRWIRSGVYNRKMGRIDLAVIEATGVTGDGNIIPSLSVDAAPAMIESAEKVIIEINVARPVLEGIHDIPDSVGRYSYVGSVLQRIGIPYIRCLPEKIAAIVITNSEDSSPAYSGISNLDLKIAENIYEFLREESKMDKRISGEASAIQPGAGPLAGALARIFRDGAVVNRIWSEVLPTTWIENILEGSIEGASTSSLYTLSGEERYRKMLYEELSNVRKRVVLRPYEVTNSPRNILNFDLISVQQAIEVDIYGNANISHIKGDLYVGVGGSGDFTRNAYITIIALPSTTSDQRISRIVPIAHHIDVVEHDVDVIVTENCIADLRGLTPLERARVIIERCAHPKFREPLIKYYEKISMKGGHAPIDFEAASSFWREVGVE